MSKAIKTIVSVVAAIAIPFAAPAIASSIGLSAAIGTAVGSATAGAALGGALTGAALGAAKGAILGEDVGRSALMGGIGGGIGGYTAAPSAPAAAPGTISGVGQAAPVYDVSATGQLVPAAGYGQTAGLSVPGAETGFLGTYGSPTAGQLGITEVPAGTFVDGQIAQGGMSVAPTARIGFTAGEGVTVPGGTFAGGQMAQGGMSVVPGTGVGSTAYASQAMTPGSVTAGLSAVPTTAGQPSAASAAPTQPKTFAEAVKAVPGEIAAKFADPKALADLTLRAAGNLAGSALAGTGLSAEEQALLNAQTEELRMLQSTNQALFNQRLEQAQNLIGESKYFDPEYFGLQRARRAQVAGARAKRAGLRGLTGGAREAEARRFDLATGRDVGTAYDVGYGTGVSGRLQTMQAGLSQMPTSFPSSINEYSNLRQAYAGAEQRRSQQAKDIGSLFGSLTGRGG